MTTPAVNPKLVLKFMSQMGVPEGRLVGNRIQILPYQRDFVLGTLRRDPATGRRVVRDSYLGIARKNGKTVLIAAMALALLVLEAEPANEIVCAAKTRGQAGLLFKAARRIIGQTKIGDAPLSQFLEVRRDHIYNPANDSYLRVIASEAGSLHGMSPGVAIIDELHEAARDDDDLYDVLSSGQGARMDPLVIMITTAGARQSGPAFDRYVYGKEIESGLRNDPAFFFRWYEAAQGRTVDDIVGWKEASPGLGHTVSLEFYEKASQAVLNGRSSEYSFRRLQLNNWTSATERWLPWQSIQACSGPAVIPEGAEVYLGIDAALSRDTFAVSMIYVDYDGVAHNQTTGELLPAPVVHWKAKAFVPSADGGYVDPTDVQTYILGLAQRYEIVDCVYDHAYMCLLVNALAERDVPMTPFPQTSDRMTRATETFQRLFLDTRVRWGGDPVIERQMAAIGTKETERGVRMSKQKSNGGKIDVPVSGAMVMDRALGDEMAGDVSLSYD